MRQANWAFMVSVEKQYNLVNVELVVQYITYLCDRSSKLNTYIVIA
jgi:hypothetical protein